MHEQLQARLEQLQKEYELGQARLRELQAEQSHITETLLRIDGAMLVLKELLNEHKPEEEHTSQVA